jgi:hypothetical protein
MLFGDEQTGSATFIGGALMLIGGIIVNTLGRCQDP